MLMLLYISLLPSVAPDEFVQISIQHNVHFFEADQMQMSYNGGELPNAKVYSCFGRSCLFSTVHMNIMKRDQLLMS